MMLYTLIDFSTVKKVLRLAKPKLGVGYTHK
jgi:hypothetical protein